MARRVLDDLPKAGLAMGGVVAWMVSPPYPRDGDVAVPFRGAEDLGPLVQHALRPFTTFVALSFALGIAFTLALHLGIRWAGARPRADRRGVIPTARTAPGTTPRRAAAPARTPVAEPPACPGRSAVSTTLANMGLRAASDLGIRTAAGGTRIDHLVLLGDTVVVIEVLHLSGSVSGGVGEGTWVHRRAAGTERTVGNPVLAAEAKARAVRALAPAGLRVAGLAVLTGPATMPDAGTRLTALSRLPVTLDSLRGGGPGRDGGTREDAFVNLVRGIRAAVRRTGP